MNKKTVPFTSEQLENIIAQYPTPFHIYDEEGIIENMKSFINAFSWNKGFKQYFAVKATPNPYIMRLLQKLGVGADCSSLAELLLCEKVGITGHDIMFTSNDTPYVEYKKALEMGAIINLDDITHIEYLEKNHGSLPDTFCVRYNPGSLKEGGNTIIGLPEEAKYGMTREQIFEAYKQLQAKGVKHFGIHTMVVSNELDIDGFIDLGGGVGVAYKPEQTPVDFRVLSKGVEEAYNRILVANGLNDVALAYECGRMVTGPFGYLVSTAIHKKDIYRHYIGLDACMANLMRPALYGSYHHITVMGKENAPKDHVYDVTGSLCENNDKFAIQRELPKIDIGDRVIIHDAGAHGHSMGFNYNGKLRSAELLLHKDGSVTQIRRAETYDDLFGTLDFSNL
ncbi:MAG: diaminopimelate decarboxylase [Veillonella sp.]|uniref:diaminopimelate decarboxylase family protein n=1 Tax=Veillonella sp. TaxID=1926307 RepID=UPI002912E747|nr:diaminopimelate decarboxylase [Veillonella sp.]MDU6274989.1 diaminopimelate decarboxylase [Veillonella sp.]